MNPVTIRPRQAQRVTTLLMGIVCLAYVGAWADQEPNEEVLRTRFDALRVRRTDLEDKIVKSQESLAQAAMELSNSERLDRDLVEAAAEIERLSTSGAERDRRDLAVWKDRKNSLDKRRSATPSTVDLRNRKKDQESALEDSMRQKDEIEHQIATLLDIETPRRQFKKAMSIAYSMLLGGSILVFLIFFYMVSDKKLGRDLLISGEGLRFITLFSLVIAIVLFGITGILEGKELSALLGGLSGYILGRGERSMGQPAVAKDEERG